MRTTFGTFWRIVILVILIAPLAITPLFIVYRSQCPEEGNFSDSWSVVAPWDDPPSDCRDHETGFDVLRDEVGL